MLHWCLDWLERQVRGEWVMATLRPDMEDATESARFEHARVRQYLGNALVKIMTPLSGVRNKANLHR